MAVLIISPRDYARILEQATPVHTSLKLRREIQQLRSKKRSARQIQINLHQEDASAMTGTWFTARYEPDQRPHIVAELEAMATDARGELRNPPCIMYSISEWKAIIEMGTGQPSNIDLNAHGHQPVFVQLDDEWHSTDIQWYVYDMIQRTRNPNRVVHEAKTDNAQDGALAFGAVDESEELAEEAKL